MVAKARNKASMKTRTTSAFQVVTPKRGKARLVRKPRGVLKKPTSNVKYVRSGQPSLKSRGDRTKCSLTLPDLLAMTEDQLID
jgi:hypothetical protein